jgi:PPE-repeat protein
MTVSATEQVGVMAAALGWLTEGAASLASAGQTYQTAFDSMIPGPVCETNRATQAALVASNVLGQNSPAIAALDAEYFGHMWTTNAAAMSSWQAAAMATITSLTVPPPFNPVIADPAGPAAALAGTAAQTGMQGATQPMQAAGGSSMMSEITPLLSQFGQVGSMAGQLPQMMGQLPQMAGQFPQMLTGMLGGNLMNPASSGLTATDAPLAVGAVGAGGSLGAASSAAGAGSGLGGGVGGMGALPGITSSSYTRPANAFTPPATPKMPTGWDIAPAPTPGTAAPTGGMYGAAPASALGTQTETEKPPARTVKVAPRSR